VPFCVRSETVSGCPEPARHDESSHVVFQGSLVQSVGVHQHISQAVGMIPLSNFPNSSCSVLVLVYVEGQRKESAKAMRSNSGTRTSPSNETTLEPVVEEFIAVITKDKQAGRMTVPKCWLPCGEGVACEAVFQLRVYIGRREGERKTLGASRCWCGPIVGMLYWRSCDGNV
jgi:hypothetical protein